MKRLKEVRLKLWLISLIIVTIVFVMMGTLTALWHNPYFILMTPVTGWDYHILSLEAMIIGLLFGIPKPGCASKKDGVGGVFGFLGFGCLICNKLLLLLFGSSFLLTYFEPIRYYVGSNWYPDIFFRTLSENVITSIAPSRHKNGSLN